MTTYVNYIDKHIKHLWETCMDRFSNIVQKLKEDGDRMKILNETQRMVDVRELMELKYMESPSQTALIFSLMSPLVTPTRKSGDKIPLNGNLSDGSNRCQNLFHLRGFLVSFPIC
jgi:hypothetical protein